MEAQCPVCGTIRLPEVTACDCGFRFSIKRSDPTPTQIAEEWERKRMLLLMALSPTVAMANSSNKTVKRIGTVLSLVIGIPLLLIVLIAIGWGIFRS